MTERIFDLVPNVAFFKTVQQYAFWRGKPHLTHNHCISNLINYIKIAEILN